MAVLKRVDFIVNHKQTKKPSKMENNDDDVLPLMSLCTIRAVCKKDTPSRICLVYFLVKLSLRAPCCFIWSCTDPCGKAKPQGKRH